MLNLADFPSREGESMFCTIEMVEIGPLPPAPAQAVQLCHPVIWSMLDLVAALAGGAGNPDVGVGLLPLTVMLTAVLVTIPAESQAWTTTLCLAADMASEVSILLLRIR